MSVVNAVNLSPEDAKIAAAINYIGELLQEVDPELYALGLSEIFDGDQEFSSNKEFLLFAFRKILDILRLVNF